MEKPSSFFASPTFPWQIMLLIVLVSHLLVVAKSDVDNGVQLVNVSKLEMFVDELPSMPKLQGYNIEDGVIVPGNLTIGMFEKYWKFHRDMPQTLVFAYGTDKESATVPGPTIEAIQGIPSYVTWQNYLPSRHILPWDPTIATAVPGSNGGIPTVVHLHGGLSPPSSDGHSHAWFTSSYASVGPAFSGPTSYYPNHQLPGNLWYHDHAMGLTRVNILSGLLGAYVIRSPVLEMPLNLPSAPEFDQNLVVFDRQFAVDGSIYMTKTGNNPDIHPEWQPEYFGDAVIVNGKAWPYLNVQRRRYRFRILNASNARFYRFLLSNGLRFIFIGSDSNYLSRRSTSHSFLLAPSEIADVIIDFAESTTDEAVLLNNAPAPFPDGDAPSTELATVMKFIIAKENVVDTSSVPRRLLNLPPLALHRVVQTRQITLYEFENPVNGEPTHLLLNFKTFSAPATETPKVGTSEVWELINLTEDNHPMHIHLGTFMVLEQRELVDEDNLKACLNTTFDAVKCNLKKYAKGVVVEVPKNERGWKNVFKLKPGFVTRIVVRFSPLQGGSYPFDATAEPGYAYHCHILDHEDNEMMRPLKLVN